jgi:hypothetical protein
MPLSLDKLKVAAVGLLVVAEDSMFTCYLTQESLAEIVAAKGGKLQDGVNSATDVVVLGNWEREKDDFKDSTKVAGLETEKQLQASGARKKPLRVMSLKQFCETFDVQHEVLEGSCTARYKGENFPFRFIPPGPQRTRGTFLPRILGCLDASGKETEAKGLVYDLLTPDDLFPAH